MTASQQFRFRKASLTALSKALEKSGRKLPAEMAIVLNASAKTMKVQASKEIRKELAAKSSMLKRSLRNIKATKTELSAGVGVNKEKRISLREFGAKQSKKGVSYKISKTGGRKTVANAFQGPKPGAIKASWRGHVFARTTKARLPIVKLFGPSPWGAFVKQGMSAEVMRAGKKTFGNQIQRRIRFNVLKASGVIK